MHILLLVLVFQSTGDGTASATESGLPFVNIASYGLYLPLCSQARPGCLVRFHIARGVIPEFRGIRPGKAGPGVRRCRMISREGVQKTHEPDPHAVRMKATYSPRLAPGSGPWRDLLPGVLSPLMQLRIRQRTSYYPNRGRPHEDIRRNRFTTGAFHRNFPWRDRRFDDRRIMALFVPRVRLVRGGRFPPRPTAQGARGISRFMVV